MNPKKLKPFQIAFDNKRRMRDEENWLYWGTYGLSALQTVMSHFVAGLSGKKSDIEYIKKPIYQQANNKAEELTEEEKKQQTEQLFMQLQIMGANHKLSKKDGSK